MNQSETERRARLMAMSAKRLPKIKKEFAERQAAKANPMSDKINAFDELQDRHFNSNFEKDGKDAHFIKKSAKKSKSSKTTSGASKKSSKSAKTAKTADKTSKAALGVSVRKGEMIF